MIESGYYPIGEEYNPNAPYNQSNIEPIQLKVIISQSLSRPTTIEVTDYINKFSNFSIMIFYFSNLRLCISMNT